VGPVGTRRITIFTPEAGGFYVGDICAGVDEVCRARHSQPIFIQTALSWEGAAYEPLPATRYLKLASSLRGGSLVVTGVHAKGDMPLLAQIAEPVVAVAGPPVREGGISVVVDNKTGVVAAVRHLIEHGHARIGFAGAAFLFDIRERYDAYVETLDAAGLKADPAVFFGVHDSLTLSGHRAADSIVEAGVNVTAVFASTDTLAVALMERLRERGVRVPEDVAVVGFDDADIAQTAVPSLTSVRQTPQGLGITAARLLLDEMDGLPVEPGRHVIETTLIKRHSCGCFDTNEHLFDLDYDWASPGWREHLADVLVRALMAPTGVDYGPSDRDAVWPSLDVIVEAFDRAIKGFQATNISGLDEAWWAASIRTRNAETLLRLVDLLEYVGMFRQGVAGGDPNAMRVMLRDFLAQSRMQVLRYAAIADPFRHPDGPRATRWLIRSFQDRDAIMSRNLDWLGDVEGIKGCLALWEPGRSGEPERLRVEAVFGTDGIEIGSRWELGSFPPPAMLDVPRPDGTPMAVMIVPVASLGKEWGVLATVMPDRRRYFDGYWDIQYGASLLAIALERSQASAAG
jgi:DNA-binding LacI/PurR family transcriptional regulator